MDWEELEIFSRGVTATVTDKFWDIECKAEHDISLRSHLIRIVGKTLGKTLDEIEFPLYWERLLKRKDCPKYMKALKKVNVNVYYPTIPIPDKPHWLSID